MSGKTILIVDDSPTEIHVLSGILLGAGYNVAVAESGEVGVDMARSSSPDLILMDVVMPGLNGFQATRQLKRDENTSNIPVILVTTKDQETDKAWGMRQGAKDYIVKPVKADELLSKISAIIG